MNQQCSFFRLPPELLIQIFRILGTSDLARCLPVRVLFVTPSILLITHLGLVGVQRAPGSYQKLSYSSVQLSSECFRTGRCVRYHTDLYGGTPPTTRGSQQVMAKPRGPARGPRRTTSQPNRSVPLHISNRRRVYGCSHPCEPNIRFPPRIQRITRTDIQRVIRLYRPCRNWMHRDRPSPRLAGGRRYGARTIRVCVVPPIFKYPWLKISYRIVGSDFTLVWHLRRLSNPNVQHPLASTPQIRFPNPFAPYGTIDECVQHLHIRGTVVAAHIPYSADYGLEAIVMFDWKSGFIHSVI